MIAHQYAFDKVFVLQTKEILDRAVFFGEKFSLNHDATVGESGELFAQCRRKIGHLLDACAAVEPFPNLLCAILWFTKFAEQTLYFRSG